MEAYAHLLALGVLLETHVGHIRVLVQILILAEWLEIVLGLLRRHWGQLAGGVLLAVLLLEHYDLLGQEVLVLPVGELQLVGARVLLGAA